MQYKTGKSVWLINQYTSTPRLGGGGNRTYYIAKELVKNGYSVTLITSSYSHVPKRNFEIEEHFHFELEEDINIVVVKNIVYESGKSFLRIISMLIFWLKLYFLPLKKLISPDVIIVSSISLLPILNAFKFKVKYKNKPKVILEIRDIWPLSLHELGGYSKYNPFILLLSYIEKKAYKNADYITSVLPFADKHIYDTIKKDFKFKHISNGIHLENIKNRELLTPEIDALIPNNKFIVGYTGALGIANSMENFVDLAILNKKNTSLYFIIVGDGYSKKILQEKAIGLNNILFIDRIPKNQIQSILERFDILYIAAQDKPIYQFGISANKLFDYMYAERPIIMDGNFMSSDGYTSKSGMVVYPSNVSKLNKTINYFMNMAIEDRLIYGKRGKEYVLNYRTYEYLAQLYVEIFEELKAN